MRFLFVLITFTSAFSQQFFKSVEFGLGTTPIGNGFSKLYAMPVNVHFGTKLMALGDFDFNLGFDYSFYKGNESPAHLKNGESKLQMFHLAPEISENLSHYGLSDAITLKFALPTGYYLTSAYAAETTFEKPYGTGKIRGFLNKKFSIGERLEFEYRITEWENSGLFLNVSHAFHFVWEIPQAKNASSGAIGTPVKPKGVDDSVYFYGFLSQPEISLSYQIKL